MAYVEGTLLAPRTKRVVYNPPLVRYTSAGGPPRATLTVRDSRVPTPKANVGATAILSPEQLGELRPEAIRALRSVAVETITAQSGGFAQYNAGPNAISISPDLYGSDVALHESLHAVAQARYGNIAPTGMNLPASLQREATNRYGVGPQAVLGAGNVIGAAYRGRQWMDAMSRGGIGQSPVIDPGEQYAQLLQGGARNLTGSLMPYSPFTQEAFVAGRSLVQAQHRGGTGYGKLSLETLRAMYGS